MGKYHRVIVHDRTQHPPIPHPPHLSSLFPLPSLPPSRKFHAGVTQTTYPSSNQSPITQLSMQTPTANLPAPIYNTCSSTYPGTCTPVG